MNLHVHKLDGTRASRVYTAKPYRFTKADLHFVETIANVGAVALQNLRAYNFIQKDYKIFRREMLQWRAELGDEWLMGEIVKPPRNTHLRYPQEDKIKQTAEAWLVTQSPRFYDILNARAGFRGRSSRGRFRG